MITRRADRLPPYSIMLKQWSKHVCFFIVKPSMVAVLMFLSIIILASYRYKSVLDSDMCVNCGDKKSFSRRKVASALKYVPDSSGHILSSAHTSGEAGTQLKYMNEKTQTDSTQTKLSPKVINNIKPQPSKNIANKIVAKGTQLLHKTADTEPTRVKTEKDSKVNVLIILDSLKPSYTEGAIMTFLDAYHINFTIMHHDIDKALLNSTSFSIVIITTMSTLLAVPLRDYGFLKAYCKQRNIGMIIFSDLSHNLTTPIHLMQLGQPVNVSTVNNVTAYQLNEHSNVLNITRAGGILHHSLPATKQVWAAYSFRVMRDRYQPLAFAMASDNSSHTTRYVTALVDTGAGDGIKKVHFGYGLTFWLHYYLFVDAMHFLTEGKIKIPFQRYLMIDIDDVFRGTDIKEGLTNDDVKVMVKLSQDVKSDIANFKFGMLFCSGAYAWCLKQNQTDISSNILVHKKELFRWYDHTYHHINASEAYYVTDPNNIIEEMQINRLFAKKHQIFVNEEYMVTKAHTGIYPPVDNVYYALNKMGVRVTGTDRYIKSRYRSTHRAAGFMYKGMAVLPRVEWAGLGATYEQFDDFADGKTTFLNDIYKFLSKILILQTSIQFIHNLNFGKDRLGPLAMRWALEGLRKWTNIQLIAKEPLELAEIHFRLYPEDIRPTWEHPCTAPSIRTLWDSTKSCDRFPNMLLVGPPQTGASVLSWLLQLHPNITSPTTPSVQDDIHFLDKNYLKGIDWYYDKLSQTNSSNNTAIVFEKTESYFCAYGVAERAKFIMLDGLVIVTMTNPKTRAFTVYKKSPVATKLQNIMFYNIITAPDTAPPTITSLRDNVLLPGKYIEYIHQWEQYFKGDKLVVVDGEELVRHPVETMNYLQALIGIKNKLDYTTLISIKDGNMLCSIKDDAKCFKTENLWQPEELTKNENDFLEAYYHDYNEKLMPYLDRRGFHIPNWLHTSPYSPMKKSAAT